MSVGDLPEARVMASIKQAWTNIWPNFWWLLLFGLLTGIATNTTAGSDTTLPSGMVVTVNIVGSLIAVFVGIPLSVGLVKAHLAASRGEKPTWSDLGYAFGPRYWASVGLGVLSALIVVGGLLLLVIPGIYWGVKLSFAAERFIVDDLDPVAAIKASFADVTGHWWSVFGLALMAFVLILAGLLALIVGVFVAAVLVEQMSVVYWRALVERRGATPPAPPAGAAPA